MDSAGIVGQVGLACWLSIFRLSAKYILLVAKHSRAFGQVESACGLSISCLSAKHSRLSGQVGSACRLSIISCLAVLFRQSARSWRDGGLPGNNPADRIFPCEVPERAADVSVNGTLSVEQLCEIKTTEKLAEVVNHV